MSLTDCGSAPVANSAESLSRVTALPLMTELGPCLPRAVDAFPIVYFVCAKVHKDFGAAG